MVDECPPSRVERGSRLDVELMRQCAHEEFEILAKGERLQTQASRHLWIAEECNQLSFATGLPLGAPALPTPSANEPKNYAEDETSGGRIRRRWHWRWLAAK